MYLQKLVSVQNSERRQTQFTWRLGPRIPIWTKCLANRKWVSIHTLKKSLCKSNCKLKYHVYVTLSCIVYFFRFRQELLDIGTTIEERNKSRDEFYYYKYLHPSEIPNSISIWVLLWNDALLVINVEVFILSNLNRRDERCGYWINKFFSGSRWLGMIMSNQTIENSWTWNT